MVIGQNQGQNPNNSRVQVQVQVQIQVQVQGQAQNNITKNDKGELKNEETKAQTKEIKKI